MRIIEIIKHTMEKHEQENFSRFKPEINDEKNTFLI